MPAKNPRPFRAAAPKARAKTQVKAKPKTQAKTQPKAKPETQAKPATPPAADQARLLAQGKSLRQKLARDAHAKLRLPKKRDPLKIIDATHVGRVEELIGVRTYRMSQSPFAYYRATADVMAADLAAGVNTGIELMICGDAHISNFGLYASPERRLLFDLNDFDEAGPGPWEWDIQRMAASIVLALREKDCPRKIQRQTVRHAVSAYQQNLHELMEKSALERYYASVDADWLLRVTRDQQLARSMKKARRNTSARVLQKIATQDGPQGEHCRIQDNPPLLVHDRNLSAEHIAQMLAQYLQTLAPDRALLMSQWRVLDIARRVVGVGSVGTRCGIALLQDGGGHTLFMQYKQAGDSVLKRWGGVGHGAQHNGQRVVAAQQILQAVSDPLLGWNTGADDGITYYWRQFRDMKGSVDLNLLSVDQLDRYARLCARLLARAHAQSPQAAAVSGYLGRNDDFAQAIAVWALAYADQVERDYKAFMRALRKKRYPFTPEKV